MFQQAFNSVARLTFGYFRYGRRDLDRHDVGTEGSHGPIDEHATHVVEQLLSTVQRGQEVEEVRVLVNEVRVHVA